MHTILCIQDTQYRIQDTGYRTTVKISLNQHYWCSIYPQLCWGLFPFVIVWSLLQIEMPLDIYLTNKFLEKIVQETQYLFPFFVNIICWPSVLWGHLWSLSCIGWKWLWELQCKHFLSNISKPLMQTSALIVTFTFCILCSGWHYNHLICDSGIISSKYAPDNSYSFFIA